MKNILIINSLPAGGELLAELLEEFSPGFRFSLLSAGTDNRLPAFFKQKNWPVKKIRLGPPLQGGFLPNLYFSLLYPVFLISNLFRLAYLKYRGKIDTIVCLGLNGKLLLTLPAALLKIRAVWLELPNENLDIPKFAGHCFSFSARRAVLVAFTGQDRERLKRRAGTEKISGIPPGIRLNQFKYQDNIFNNLAHLEAGQKKFFTLGVVARLEGQKILHRFEILFGAVKKSLNVAPNLQLIIVGDGAERKKLVWLAKKLEIESLVWLVGEQAHIRKWLDGFDVFLIISERPDAQDFLLALKAMAAELPVIAPDDAGLEEIVEDGKTGFLVRLGDDEKLTEKIINLRRDKYLVKRLGLAGKERVLKNFDIAKTREEFEELL